MSSPGIFRRLNTLGKGKSSSKNHPWEKDMLVSRRVMNQTTTKNGPANEALVWLSHDHDQVRELHAEPPKLRYKYIHNGLVMLMFIKVRKCSKFQPWSLQTHICLLKCSWKFVQVSPNLGTTRWQQYNHTFTWLGSYHHAMTLVTGQTFASTMEGLK